MHGFLKQSESLNFIEHMLFDILYISIILLLLYKFILLILSLRQCLDQYTFCVG